MNRVSDQERFSPGSHEQFAAEYLAEIRELAEVSTLPAFDSLVARFEDYSSYLAEKGRIEDPLETIVKESGGSRQVDVMAGNGEIREAMAVAHIAACCHLLHSSRLTRSNLQPDNLLALANQFLESCKNKNDEHRNRMIGKLHAMDTMRTIQLLRVLGLVTRPFSGVYQLGFGAADGTRDVLSFHLAPSINSSNEPGGPFLIMQAERREVADAIIVDADPIYKEQYDALNNDITMNVAAYNCDTIEALELIPQKMSRKRNLVTGLRIDHRMLPNVEAFLCKLAACIEDKSDLVMSIGAGDTIDEFEGRILKFKEIFNVLESVALQPVLFKLHGGGSLEQQWGSLKIGNPRASCYQILYCRIGAAALAKACES